MNSSDKSQRKEGSKTSVESVQWRISHEFLIRALSSALATLMTGYPHGISFLFFLPSALQTHGPFTYTSCERN